MSEVLQGVKFDFIRYANCWEDADVLLSAIEPECPKRIAIVASAGDNALALLTSEPESVLAFDLSLPQLYLSELKQTAFARLEYDEVLQLLGINHTNPERSIQLLNHISQSLSVAASTYWKERKELIAKGVIHCGKFEKYFSLFRRYCLPLVHSRKDVQMLLTAKSDDEQAAYYRQHWNNPGWRLLMSIFFSRLVMGRAGRDPHFLKQVELSVPAYIRQKAAAHLQSSDATHNHLLHFIFTGRFDEVLPHYLRPENFKSIKENIGRLTLRQASADDVVSTSAHDAYCLSNIFEYYPAAEFEKIVDRWAELVSPGALLLYWNLMVPRSFAGLAPECFFRITMPADMHDAGFFYSAFLKEQRR